MRRRLLLPGLICLTVALPGLLYGQTDNKLLALMPELRKLPSPDWVTEGTRVTYYSAAATLPANRFYYYKNEHGDWTQGDEVGPAGGGFTQYSVVARSETTVTGVLENYMQDVGSGIMVPSYVGGSTEPAGAGACWANTAALARADRFQSKNLLVIKGPYPLGGQTYKSIRFHYVSDDSVTDEVYDLASGLILFHGTVALSADRRYTNLTQITFRARRRVALLANQPDLPDGLRQLRQLQYQGQLYVMMPGSPLFPMPMSLQLQKLEGGARWAKYQLTKQSQGQMPATAEVICGAAQLLGEPFMSPHLLESLQPGQVVDEDPTLQVVTRVEGIGPQGPFPNVVTISQSGKGFQRLRGYDRSSGKLLLVQTDQQVGGATQRTQLQLVGG